MSTGTFRQVGHRLCSIQLPLEPTKGCTGVKPLAFSLPSLPSLLLSFFDEEPCAKHPTSAHLSVCLSFGLSIYVASTIHFQTPDVGQGCVANRAMIRGAGWKEYSRALRRSNYI